LLCKSVIVVQVAFRFVEQFLLDLADDLSPSVPWLSFFPWQRAILFIRDIIRSDRWLL